jgi:hypothetical protein
MANIDFLVVEQHAIDSLDSAVGRLGGFVMNETIALGATLLIRSDLAGEDIAKGSKGVMESLRTSEPTCIYVSNSLTLLSICSSRFLMKMLP